MEKIEPDDPPTNLGVIVGSREFFPDELAVEGGREVIETIKKQGFNVVTLFSAELGEGLAKTREDSKKYANLFKKEGLEGILITLPNFGDEKSVAEIFKLSGLDVPVLVHAFPDKKDKMDRENRRDSYCGKISVCNNLRQYGVPFTNTERHVEDPTSEEFKEDLNQFEKICRTVNGLRNARLGLVGPRPNPFQTVRYSERILESEEISVENISLAEMLEQSRKLDEKNPKVLEKLEELKKQFTLKDIPEEALMKTAKLATFLLEWSGSNELDAISLQCWPAIEEYYGIAPCGAMSILSEGLVPSACESDVMGSLSMLALQLASERRPALIDINNNYGEDPNKFVAFHCSNFPRSVFEDGKCELGYHEMQEVYGACNGRIASGPATFLRISTDDKRGKIRSYIAEGKFTEDELKTFGGSGVVEINELQSLFNYIVRDGFEHHVAVVLDHVGDVLEEALGNYLGWEVYHHAPATE